MNFLLKVFISKYGVPIGRRLYADYRERQRQRHNAEAIRYQRGMTTHWIDDLDDRE